MAHNEEPAVLWAPPFYQISVLKQGIPLPLSGGGGGGEVKIDKEYPY